MDMFSFPSILFLVKLGISEPSWDLARLTANSFHSLTHSFIHI